MDQQDIVYALFISIMKFHYGWAWCVCAFTCQIRSCMQKSFTNPTVLCKLQNAIDTRVCYYQSCDYESLKGRYYSRQTWGALRWSKLGLQSEMSLRFTDFIIGNKCLETEGGPFMTVVNILLGKCTSCCLPPSGRRINLQFP